VVLFAHFSDELEQGAAGFWRFGFGCFLACITDQLADLLDVGIRLQRQPLVQCGVVFD
jgi:hypothetical protein